MLMHRTDRAPSLGIISLDDEIDEQTAHRLLAEAGQAVDDGVLAIVLDCTQLRFLTPYGLASLLRVRKLLKARFGSGRDRLRLAGVRSSVLEVIESADLSDAFGVYPDLAAAIAAEVPGEEPANPAGCCGAARLTLDDALSHTARTSPMSASNTPMACRDVALFAF